MYRRVDVRVLRCVERMRGAAGNGVISVFFFFNDTATTEIYTLSLHDALPILDLFAPAHARELLVHQHPQDLGLRDERHVRQDRKSTRLNSSHANISYAVFCLKKKMILHSLLVVRLSFICSVSLLSSLTLLYSS